MILARADFNGRADTLLTDILERSQTKNQKHLHIVLKNGGRITNLSITGIKKQKSSEENLNQFI